MAKKKPTNSDFSIPDTSGVQQCAQIAVATLRDIESKLREGAESLQGQRDQLEKEKAELEHDRHKQTIAEAELAERSQILGDAQQRMEKLSNELEPRALEIKAKEEELSARADELGALSLELDQTRDALTALQKEVAEGKRDVAARQEELSAQLAQLQFEPVNGPRLVRDQAFEPTAKPKPAAGAAARQFRKLRRDSKRKAIGA